MSIYWDITSNCTNNNSLTLNFHISPTTLVVYIASPLWSILFFSSPHWVFSSFWLISHIKYYDNLHSFVSYNTTWLLRPPHRITVYTLYHKHIIYYTIHITMSWLFFHMYISLAFVIPLPIFVSSLLTLFCVDIQKYVSNLQSDNRVQTFHPLISLTYISCCS